MRNRTVNGALLLLWATSVLGACGGTEEHLTIDNRGEGATPSKPATSAAADSGTKQEPFRIISGAFAEEGMIPRANTCDDMDRSPELSWSNVPQGTQSLALIVSDPDAVHESWIHWVVYNMQPDRKNLREGIPTKPELPNGGTQGINDFGSVGYEGPCPPSGVHHYLFTLYALDLPPTLGTGLTAKALQKAMDGHILAQTTVRGRYARR